VGTPRRHRAPNVSSAHRRIATAPAVRLALVGALVVAGAVSVAISLTPYETLKDHLDPFTVDRDADVSRGEFDDIVLRLRVVAAGLLTFGVALVAFGTTLDRVVTEVARSWWRSTRRTPAALRQWLANETPWYLASFGLILAVAVAVRVAFLDVPLRYDEATTYDNFVSQPIYVALANYATPNNHLLHTFLAKVFTTLLGNEPWAIRLPALLAGIALIPATFALGRVLYGHVAALIAASLVATSSTLVEYSTNARGYTLVGLATVIAFLAAARTLDDNSVGAWALVAVAGALGLYAVPVMIYPLGGVLLWLLVAGRAAGHPLRPLLERLAACALAIALLTLVLYAPVYAASGVRSVTSNEFVEPQSWSTLLELLPGHARDTVETWTRDLPIIVSILLAAGVAASIVLTPRISRFPIPPLAAVIVWTLPALALQRIVPFTRVWLFLVPLLAVTAAGFYGWLLERPRWGARVAAALAALVAVGAALAVVAEDSVRESRETGALLDAPAVADYLAGVVRADDRILAIGSDTILEYYLERDGVEAGSLIYSDEPRARTYVVVNVLGGQSLDDLVRQLHTSSGELGPPELLRSYPSAQVFLVARRG